jgi:hypothetical protein
MSATYWKASPSSLIAMAAYARRKSRRPKRVRTPSGGASARGSSSSGVDVTGSATRELYPEGEGYTGRDAPDDRGPPDR